MASLICLRRGLKKATRYLDVGSRAFATSIPRSRTRDGRRLILGIESSCDDSCAALISCDDSYTASKFAPSSSETEPSRTDTAPPSIVSSVIVRQDHAKTAGIHPIIAQTYHMRSMPGAIRKCLDEGGVSADGRELDAIAFTHGPGMAGCLSVGLTAAKTLAATWSKPLIPVHHMEAHALTPFLLESPSETMPLRFPFLTFLLSGGHSLLVLAKSLGDYQILATSPCEAIGASFDNAARIFDLKTDWMKRSPGAALEAFAADAPSECPPDLQPLFRPLKISFVGEPAMEFSGLASGLAQHQEYIASDPAHQGKKMSDLPLHWQKYIASQYQVSAFGQLKDKVKMIMRGTQAMENYRRTLDPLASKGDDSQTSASPHLPQSKSRWKPKPFPSVWASSAEAIASCRHLVVSGGVASNLALRSTLAEVWREDEGRRLVFPPVQYCVDNAVMIANMGALMYDEYVDSDTGARKESRYTQALDTTPRARWSMEDLAAEREKLKAEAEGIAQ